MAYLNITNFTKSFGDVEVLKGIDLCVKKGEVVSIIGSSGSGKTTLLRSINFLETCDKGTMILEDNVLFDATQTKKDSEKVLREKRLNFGLVFQSFNLFPQYNVLKNITLAPMLLLGDEIKELKKTLKSQGIKGKQLKEMLAKEKDSHKEQINAYAQELLEKIGLVEKANAYPCELSGGQCQRVAIARALALKPKVLCFDEPTSALDPELTGEVLKVIRSLKDEGITMIIVTHEIGFAKNVSDKIIFLHNGVVEESGDPKKIIENPKSDALKAFLSSVTEKDG